eukprot:CAMPEP_0181210848 /NCGR_PEP_ID=MMETSP1096-20121128/23462_1 /TAXON_ID=156174 ORGANISM="Chrysochromulina ericina, Strain CCMP281" /NCGR_SAMPLE_ID=MMETSP1096 /ASSEMBLY_ACC=CAM_ASM_000453 /LENGTH=35 /DNA_ID= /DNA_START= /DNA_END= /DNA_ORIENTATION=
MASRELVTRVLRSMWMKDPKRRRILQSNHRWHPTK